MDVVFPIMPTWDASSADFAVATLFANIETPPQPGYGYPTYIDYETDLFGNARSGIGAGLMASAEPPVCLDGYPSVSVISGTSAQVLVASSKDGNVYYVVLPEGSTIPTPEQIRDGKDSEGLDVITTLKGSTNVLENEETVVFVNNLLSLHSYDICFIGEDSDSLLWAVGKKVQVTTTDVVAPVWIQTPITTTIHYKYIDFSMKLDSDCKTYFVAIKGNSNSPSSVQVKNGTDSEGRIVISGNFGNVEVLANQESKITVTNVCYGVYDFYDVYFVAEDELGNLQETPFKVSVNVPQLEPVNPKIPGSSFERQIIAGKGNSDLLLPKVTSLFRGLVLPNMRKDKE
jgi:hypothetical protein